MDRLDGNAAPNTGSSVSYQLLGSNGSRQSTQAILVDVIYKNKWRPDQQKDLDSFSKILSELSADQRSHILAKRILEMIRFDEIRDRYEAIPEAYRKTFDWIFQEPGPQDAGSSTTSGLKESNSFVKWLHSPDSLYWITGKPGSGKSTLMKYLYDHPQTKMNIQLWHEECYLVTAGFFFWNSGTQVQMSQVGLLRSLLYQILVSNRELIPVVFPKRWEVFELIGGDPEPLSWEELTTGLKIAVNNLDKRFFLCIDGLDEFDGDPVELLQLITDLCHNTNVKICVSSRPWLVFEEAFNSRPWLRLESLTYNDISFFVKDKMETSTMFKTMRTVRPEMADSLVHEITERASGSFSGFILW